MCAIEHVRVGVLPHSTLRALPIPRICRTVRLFHDLFEVSDGLEQGCGVGAGVGVARSRGNEPGVGVGVGVDQLPWLRLRNAY